MLRFVLIELIICVLEDWASGTWGEAHLFLV